MAAIKLEHLVKKFGDHAVIRDVSLEIADKEFVVFVGPSGCGKSTMLRLIAGLEEATEGGIVIDGEDVTALSAAERGLSMVFQSYALYPHKSVRENMGFPLQVAGTPKAVIREKVNEAAEILQLQELLDRKPKDLSGGQRQRVAIGRSIVRDPRAFLFDEPLSNLDAALRVDTRVQIARLRHRLKATMIYVTHDQVEAMTLADRIIVFSAGKIEQVGKPLELYHQPANLFVAEFIGSPKTNILSCTGSAQAETVELANGSHLTCRRSAVDTDDAVARFVGIRPEHMQVLRTNEVDSSLPNQLSGVVAVAEHLGSDSFVHVDVEGLGTLVVRADPEQQLQAEEPVIVNARADKLMLFDAGGNALR